VESRAETNAMPPAYDLGHSGEAYQPLDTGSGGGNEACAPNSSSAQIRHSMGFRTSWMRQFRRYKLPMVLLMLLFLVSCLAYRILSVGIPVSPSFGYRK